MQYICGVMKVIRFILALVVTVSLAVAVEVSVEYLTARSDGRSITIEWKPTTERDVKRYDLERSNDNRSWMPIASFDAKGNGTVYRYVDSDVLGKSSDNDPRTTAKVYYYRLRIFGSDNSISYTSSTAVSHNLSTVRRTWGMIKEMFK